MKTKLTLFVAVLAVALFGMGCASTEPAFVSDGLVAYYPFNGNAKDESGNGNDGEVNGATPTEDRNGEKGSSYNFDGDDYIELGPMNFGDELTVSAWVNLVESTGQGNMVFTKYDGQESGDLQPTRRSVQLDIANSIGWSISSTSRRPDMRSDEKNLMLNKMYHVVCSYGGGKQAIYIDGKLDNQISVGKAAIFKSDVPVSIGANIAFVKRNENEPASRVVLHHLKGEIDDVRIYNRVLSAEEVKALYDLEKPEEK
jgi:hypothetical protein